MKTSTITKLSLIKDKARHYAEEWMKFDRIPESEKLHEDPIICGLMYLRNISNGVSYLKIHAYPEYLTSYVGFMHNDLLDEDIIYLLRCGF